jgi:transposase-like protein
LAAFERSGQSAAAFARDHGIGYSTFFSWRAQRTRTPSGPEFVEVQLSVPATPQPLVIELGAHARLPITSPGQIDYAVRLLQALNALEAC